MTDTEHTTSGSNEEDLICLAFKPKFDVRVTNSLVDSVIT